MELESHGLWKKIAGGPPPTETRSRERDELEQASGRWPESATGDGPYADLQCWRLEGGDLDFALETRCGMPEQCSSGENAEDVLSQAGESMSGTIGAAWQQK